MSTKLRVSQARSYVTFFCPGCKMSHTISVNTNERPSWTWNGSSEKPTFSPSILHSTGHYVQNQPPGNCYCDAEQRMPGWDNDGWSCQRCHSFVKEGMIEFLGDCSHNLAGQTVPLPDFPEAK